jgi:hypothetical protein
MTVCPRLCGVAGQIARIEAARGRSRGIGRMKIGHSEALVPGQFARASGLPVTHTLSVLFEITRVVKKPPPYGCTSVGVNLV